MAAFFDNQTCLIVEPSQAFLSSIQSCISSLDMPSLKVMVAKKWEDALNFVRTEKPKMLITETDVSGHLGLELIEIQQQIFGDNERVAIVISHDSSDSMIAEAAEEQVDVFLLKPFSTDQFRQKLIASLEKKITPTPYMATIREAKEKQAQKDYDSAISLLNKAKLMIDKPSLACAYLGSIYRLKDDRKSALSEFRRGRTFHSMHYQCIIGEFEVLMDEKDYAKAYELIPVISKNFPLTPKRLGQVFIASVCAHRFENLGEHFQLFSNLEKRSPELVKVASMALIAGGKYFLSQKNLFKAADLFEKALAVASREFTYVQNIANELLGVGAREEAKSVIQKTLQADQKNPGYDRLNFKYDLLTLTPGQLIDAARKHGNSGNADQETYVAVIKILAEAKKETLAESIIVKALQTYPDLRSRLYEILAQNA